MDGHDKQPPSEARDAAEDRVLVRAFQATRVRVRNTRWLRRLLAPFWIFALVCRQRWAELRQHYRHFRVLGARAWVRQTPAVRRVLEPPWIAILVLRQKWQELRQWERNHAFETRNRKLVQPAQHRVVGVLYRSKTVLFAVPLTLLRTAYAFARRIAGIGDEITRLRSHALHFALTNERRAIDWAYRRDAKPSWLKSMAGRAALAAANIYYLRAFRTFARAGSSPLLPPSAFDPNHVMLIVGTLGPGGAERQVVTTLLGLKRAANFRLTLVCIFLDQEWQRFFLGTLRSAGIEVVQIGRSAPRECLSDPAAQARFDEIFGTLPPNLSDIAYYAAEIMRRRPGILHLWMDETNCKGGLAALAVGVPRILMSARSVAPHHFGFYHQYQKEAYRTVLRRRGTTLLNNSRAGALDYAQWLGVGRGRIDVIHNGFHFEDLPDPAERAAIRARFRAHLGWDDECVVVGTIIRFTEEKRPPLWVETALQLAELRPAVRFLLVGDGPMREPMQALVHARGRAANFAFTGYMRDTVTALLAMDVFMLTSRKEGFPNVLVEAQAIGIPVVAVDAGGAAETFAAGESGLLVHSGEPEQLVAALLELVDDPALRRRLGLHAEPQVRERFSIDAMIAATLESYRRQSAG